MLFNVDRNSEAAALSGIMLMSGQTKISRLLSGTNLDEHIKNVSSHMQAFVFSEACIIIDFALPQRTSPMKIQATFEKAYWKLEPK